MEMKKLLLIPFVGMVAAFVMLNIVSTKIGCEEEHSSITNLKDINIKDDDENPEGFTALSLEIEVAKIIEE